MGDSDLTLPSPLALPLLQHLLDISSVIFPASLSFLPHIEPSTANASHGSLHDGRLCMDLRKISDKATSFPRSHTKLCWWAFSLSLLSRSRALSRPTPRKCFEVRKVSERLILYRLLGLTRAAAELGLRQEECFRNRNYHLCLLGITFSHREKSSRYRVDATECLWCHLIIWLINIKSNELHWYLKIIDFNQQSRWTLMKTYGIKIYGAIWELKCRYVFYVLMMRMVHVFKVVHLRQRLDGNTVSSSRDRVFPLDATLTMIQTLIDCDEFQDIATLRVCEHHYFLLQ